MREYAHRILVEAASPALRVRLLRGVLGVPHDHPRVVEAAEALDESKWVRQLAADQRGNGGLCISWPKTHWDRVAEPGAACTVLIDGTRRRVRVASERCNCRGKGWHEHRFLALPRSANVTQGQRIAINLI